MIIQSTTNQKVKDWTKLNQKKYRDSERLFLVEGEHLVNEALKSNVLKEIITTDENYRLDNLSQNIKIYYVSNEVLNKICNTVTPQKYVGVCSYIEEKINNTNKVLLLDRIQDPGNLGTIIRSADAFNIDLIVLGDGCCDMYNEKVVRSTQGSLFHLPIIKQELLTFIDDFDGNVFGTSLQNGKSLKNIEHRNKWAVVVGNEGSGVSSSILDKCNQNIYIEMPGQSESLNVAIATSIILYEFTK